MMVLIAQNLVNTSARFQRKILKSESKIELANSARIPMVKLITIFICNSNRIFNIKL